MRRELLGIERFMSITNGLKMGLTRCLHLAIMAIVIRKGSFRYIDDREADSSLLAWLVKVLLLKHSCWLGFFEWPSFDSHRSHKDGKLANVSKGRKYSRKSEASTFRLAGRMAL